MVFVRSKLRVVELHELQLVMFPTGQHYCQVQLIQPNQLPDVRDSGRNSTILEWVSVG